jgi:hypothetical protein
MLPVKVKEILTNVKSEEVGLGSPGKERRKSSRIA